MEFAEVLDKLFLRPAELPLDMVFTFFLRVTSSAGLSLILLAFAVCLAVTPLRPRTIADLKADKLRTAGRLLLQGLCFGASLRYIGSSATLRQAAFGPLDNLGAPRGALLFWGAYLLFALLRLLTPFGFRAGKAGSKAGKGRRNNYLLLLLCGLYMAMMTGVLIPSEILRASPAEFIDTQYYQPPLRYLLSTGLTAAGLFLLFGFCYGWLLSPKARKTYVVCALSLVAVSALNYLLFGRYGILSSTLRYETDIAPAAGPILLGLALLGAVFALAVFIRKKLSALPRILCACGCVSLAVMSAINIVSVNAQSAEIQANVSGAGGEKAELVLDREGQNVVVIMLDRAISGFVPYFLEEKPELAARFDGFTWYPNTLSYGYHTNIAAPALFGGYEYTPEKLAERAGEPLKEKHNEALKIMPVNFLEAGFNVTVCDAPYADYQWIPDMSIYDAYPEIRTYNTIGSCNDYKTEMLAEVDRIRERNLLCYGLFRCATPALQGLLYDRGRYLEADAGTESGELELMGVSADFLNSYMVMQSLPELTRITSDGQNTFLMLTNEMTHNVITLQTPDYVPVKKPDNAAYEAEHGTLTPAGREPLDVAGGTELVRIHYHSDLSAFLRLGDWFDSLRAAGVWDNTRIILVSDHGCYLGLFGSDLREKYPELANCGFYEPEQWTDTMCYNPLLMVKDFGAKGFATDHSFMINADTPALAFEGVVENPVNPFTGKPVTGAGKEAAAQRILESDWAISRNDGVFYTEPLWITFEGDNVFDPDAWSVTLPDKGLSPSPVETDP